MAATVFRHLRSSMPVLVLLLGLQSLGAGASGLSVGERHADKRGLRRFQEPLGLHSASPLVYNTDGPKGTLSLSADDAERENAYNNRGSVQKADEETRSEELQSKINLKLKEGWIKKSNKDKHKFQKMITILTEQIRQTGHETSYATKMVEGIVGKCSTMPDQWCKQVASVLLDLAQEEDQDGVRTDTVAHHREKRNAVESRGIHSHVDRFINLHDRYLREDFSELTQDEKDAQNKISKDQQSVTQYVFKELQNLLYKSRYELQDESKEVQILKPAERTTPPPRAAFVEDIPRASNLQENDYFQSYFDTESPAAAAASSFSSGDPSSSTHVYNTLIPATTDSKEPWEDMLEASHVKTKYSEKLLLSKENPSMDTTLIPPVRNSPFEEGIFLNPAQASSTQTRPFEAMQTQTNPTPTQTFLMQRQSTQKIPIEISSTNTSSTQTTNSEIPSSTLSRRTVRLPASRRPDYEYFSRHTSPSFARTTPSSPSPTLRSTPRDMLFRTSIPFTPVSPAYYDDISDEITHEYHDYVMDYDASNFDSTDPKYVLESLLSQQSSLKDLSLHSKHYENYDDGNYPLSVQPNELGVAYQPTSFGASPDSVDGEYDESNYPLYEYFIISEYPKGSSVMNVAEASSVVSPPDGIVIGASSGDNPVRETVHPFHHLFESVLANPTPVPQKSTTQSKNEVTYEIVIPENVPSKAQQLPQFLQSTKSTPERIASTSPSVIQIHLPREPAVKPELMTPAPARNQYNHQTTPQLITAFHTKDNNRRIPPIRDHPHNDQAIFKQQAPLKSPQPTPTSQTVTESPLDSHLFSSVNTLFQQLTRAPAMATTTESPNSQNTAQLLISLQKNLELLSQLQQIQQNNKVKTYPRPITVAPFHIDRYEEVPSPKPAVQQNSVDRPGEAEMDKLSPSPTSEKSPPRPSLMDFLRSSQQEDVDKLEHQTKVFETIPKEEVTTVTQKSKVPSVTSLFSFLGSKPSNNFVKFQPLSSSTSATTNQLKKNSSDKSAETSMTESSITTVGPYTFETTTAGIVSVILATSQSPSVVSENTTTEAPPKDDTFVFGIPLSIIESEFSLTSDEKQRYKSGLPQRGSEGSDLDKYEVVEESTKEPVEAEENPATAEVSHEKESGRRSSNSNSQGNDLMGRVPPSPLESELRTMSSGESVNLLDVESQASFDEIINKNQKQSFNKFSHTQHDKGFISNAQMGFFPQLMATLLAPFGTTTEANRIAASSTLGTSRPDSYFTSRAYTQSYNAFTSQALVKSSDYPHKLTGETKKYSQHEQAKLDTTTKQVPVTETVPVSTSEYDETVPMMVTESLSSESHQMATEDVGQTSPAVLTTTNDVSEPTTVVTTNDVSEPTTSLRTTNDASEPTSALRTTNDASEPTTSLRTTNDASDPTTALTTSNDIIDSQTVAFPWLYDNLQYSNTNDTTIPEDVVSDQSLENFQTTTHELTESSIGQDDETVSPVNFLYETFTAALADLHKDNSFSIAPTTPSLFMTTTVLQTDSTEETTTEQSFAVLENEYERDTESTKAYEPTTEPFWEHNELITMIHPKPSSEETTNAVDYSLLLKENGYSTETYDSEVTLPQLLRTAQILIAQSTSPSDELNSVSVTAKPTEQPQLEATLTALFLANSSEEDNLSATLDVTPTDSLSHVTIATEQRTSLPSIYSEENLTTDVAGSTSSTFSASDVTGTTHTVSSFSTDTETISPTAIATTSTTTVHSSETTTDDTNIITIPLVSTSPTPISTTISSSTSSSSSSSSTTPITKYIKRVAIKPPVAIKRRPGSSILPPQFSVLSGYNKGVPSPGTRPPSILGSLNVLRRSSNTGFAHTAETLALSRSICSAASTTDMPRTSSMRYIMQKCAMLKLSGLL